MFLVVLGFFLVVVLMMSVGYIFQKKSLSGSCGGISSLGMEKACDCDDPCDDRKEKMAKEAAELSEKEKQWQDNRII